MLTGNWLGFVSNRLTIYTLCHFIVRDNFKILFMLIII